MVILGIDPGIGRFGWGIIKNTNNKPVIVDCGCIETEVNGEAQDRLLIIGRELEKIIKKYQPDTVSIEDLFFGANSKTALLVGQARGVALFTAAKNDLSITSYTPLQVKIALTGYGRAEKSQISSMVKVILGLEKMPKLDDTTDALAIALTHAFSYKIGKLTADK